MSYNQFLAMLEEGTLILPAKNPASTGNAKMSDSSVERDAAVKEFNDGIKEVVKEMPLFSSYLESDQKDGDVAFEKDELDSEEEIMRKQDGSG